MLFITTSGHTVVQPFSENSLEKDFSILEASKTNKELYIKMWGGVPDKETFKKKYGNKNQYGK